MINLRTTIDAVKALYYKGSATDDRQFSDKLIAHLLYIARARLIQQKLDRGKQLSESMYQTFVMDFTDASFSGSQCATGLCTYKRSLYKVTPPIMSKKGPALQVLNLNGEILDNLGVTTTKYASKFALSQKKTPSWFYHNDYIWVLNSPYLKKLLIKMIGTEDQLQTELCAEGGTNCVLSYSNAFVDPDLEEELYNAVVRLMTIRQLADKLNNNVDDTLESALPAQKEITQ
jgi:hypothetical protein